MTDYIDRQAAIDAIERLILPQTKGETMAEEINRVAWRCAINCAEEIIGHLPSAEVEPVKRGKWQLKMEDVGTRGIPFKVYSFHCSVCGVGMIGRDYVRKYNYCPNCGAKNGEEK